ncbi:leucine-rich repeat and IQ domain-containing protein 1, partial [Lates japonicus]
MREMSNVVVSDTGETTEEQESFSFFKETVSDDIPPSLLSYFETSKSRAAVCEMFILEELEDTMNQATEFSKDIMELNKQVTCETENEDNNFSTDTHLLPPPTETEALFTHNVSVCPNNEDETGTNEYMGSEKYLEIEVRTLKSSMNEEEIKKSSEYQREHREKQHCEEMKKEEQRRHRERDFQEELKKIMEAEKLRQKEFELMEKRAQEKLEQEFLLQQELISNLQKRVEEERRMREEEQKRIKEERERKRKEEEEKRKREEEDRRKREEERIKRERERKRMEEEEKRNREEEDKRKREEEAIKREMERKRMEEEKRRKEEEEKRKIEEMRLEEQRRKKEEEQRKKEKEEKKRRKREEDNKKIEEEMRKKEEERKSIGCKSLQEVTTVTLEDLPGCSLSTLAQCTRLQSLTLIRCGLKSLEGVSQLPQLCYIDVQENDISFVDCENMTSLRVLRLGHNKLTSIHGLSGVENLNVLDLSYNSITRIAGLEFMRRLQRLSVDHNQLISTRGLRDVYTLLHLDCSNNHLASVEGLENSALLQTLDLRANSLTEPPSLNNHILLRELHLDDNSISSLQGLIACWLPLMHHFSVAQNRITLLPSMSDFVSLANLDLHFNCISELQNVCESLEGCQFLREVHLTGNPLQQESGWRSTLQKAVAGLRTIDGQETDSFQSAPAVQQVSLASGGFLTFCQAQLKQTCDLQLQHSRELSNASSHLDVVRSSCRHFAETLKLAEEQRFAQEYGDTSVSAGQTTPEKALERDRASTEKLAEHSETESTETVPPVIPSRNNISCSYGTLETAESWHDTLNTVTTVLNPSLHSFATKGKSSSSHLDLAPVSNHQALDLKNTAAVVIQQRWRKYRQKCGNISSPPTAERGGERGGDEGKPESGPSYINGSAIDRDYAATIIQAFWRGFALRRRLASALAAVTCPDSGEDETFEEVDMDEFVFDELLSRISEKILEEWGFTDSHTALLMLKRAQKMKSKKQQQKKLRDPSVRLALFRNCNYQRGPVEARNRPAPHNRNYMK